MRSQTFYNSPGPTGLSNWTTARLDGLSVIILNSTHSNIVDHQNIRHANLDLEIVRNILCIASSSHSRCVLLLGLSFGGPSDLRRSTSNTGGTPMSHTGSLSSTASLATSIFGFSSVVLLLNVILIAGHGPEKSGIRFQLASGS